MDQIKVVWKSYHEPEIIARGYWDQGILEDLFNRKGELTFVHGTSFDIINDAEGMEQDGAVVVINARTHFEDVAKINEDIAKLRWCVLILTGDEEGQFPWGDIRHPMLRVWAQLPRMNVHNDVSQKLPNGPRPATRKLLAEIGKQDRALDYFFAGQMNHDRRTQCRDAVAELPEGINGVFMGSDMFGKEVLSHEQYCVHLAQAKIALCPSGIETPDTFRLYEALEAGCLPIVDAFAARNQSYGFWKYLFDEDVPFPIVDYWDKLPALLPELLRDWPHNANRASAWWQQKKRNLYLKLIDDIKELNR